MLVVSPLDQSQWQAKNLWSYEHKKEKIDEIVQLIVAKLKMALASKHAETKEEGMIDRLTTKIVDNI